MKSRRIVAIVDDDRFERMSAKRAVKHNWPKARILEFSYANAMLDHLKMPGHENIDLILLDVNMPLMDGFQFADAYSSLFPEIRGNTTIVMMSNSIDPGDALCASEHPCIHKLVKKPVRPDALYRDNDS